MDETSTITDNDFSTALPAIIYVRPAGEPQAEWQFFDQGPGSFHFPPEVEISVRIQGIDDSALEELVNDLVPCAGLRFLNLSENRKVTDRGLAQLARLKRLTGLNLSSCDLSNEGLLQLANLPKLRSLNLSYCNRLTNDAARPLRSLSRLDYLDLQGTPKINHGGVKRIERRGLVIHK